MFTNYNTAQLILPIDLEVKLQKNDIAFAINDLVESIPREAFEKFYKQEGRPSYHPKIMLKIILCGYTQSAFSGRKIEDLTKDSIRMMWLAQNETPSYRTINRWRVNPYMSDLLRECFIQFRSQLIEQKLIENKAIFIDGTKIEANANKFSFVWKKLVVKNQEKLRQQSKEDYEALVAEKIIPEMSVEGELSDDDFDQIIHALKNLEHEYNGKIDASSTGKERKELRSQRKPIKQLLKNFRDNWQTRKIKYENDTVIFGNRNSYSKTDIDATFMRMKDDYMKNGQLKAGYNVQIATEGQFVLAHDVFPNPTDTKTLRPFLENIADNYFPIPDYIVADAGYGSEENYEMIYDEFERTPLITYNMYLREQKKKEI